MLENLDRPLAGDQRLVVGADHHLGAAPDGVANQILRSRTQWRRYRRGVAQRLRGDPVLAIRAVEVASEHAEAVSERARIDVKKRLLLNRIALHAADVAPRDVQLAALIETDFADTDRTVRQRTAMAAGEASKSPVRQPFVELAFPRFTPENFGERC
jgi:hypothetical protein